MVVSGFGDYRVQFVQAFGDVRVRFVDSLPSEPGVWQLVTSEPDFTIEVVSSFPDFTIEPSTFPGCGR